MKTHFTKMLSVCCVIFLGAFYTTDANAQCLTAGFGQWPSSAFTPTCDGSPAATSTVCWTDEYSEVIVVSGEDYIFSSSDATHFITISADNGASAAASGTGSVSWTATASDTIRFYTHLSSACDGEQVSHSRLVTCGAAACPDGNPGDSCDDGDADTFDDTIQADCSCVGIPVDCPGLGNFGDSCDDGNPQTIGSTVQTDCSCGGGIIPPSNDLCDNATSVACGDTVSGSTSAASAAVGLPFCGTSLTSAPGVWYSIAGDGSDVTASLCSGTSFDSKIAVFSGTCDSLVCETGNDDACGLQSEIEFTSEPETTYYIYVTGFSTSAGDFDLAVSCVVPVVDCEGTVGGTALPGTPCDDNDPNTVGEVYQPDCSCSGGVSITPNDLCENAISVACGDTVAGSTSAATADSDLPFCGTGLTSAPGVWYSILGDDSEITASLCSGTSFDSKIAVFSGTCDTLVCETGNDDSCGLQSEVTFTSVNGTTYYIYVTAFSTNSGDFDLAVSCEEPVVDCEGTVGGTALPGTPCDDNDPNTTGEVYQPDCSCGGGIITPENDNCDGAIALACGDSIDGTTEGATPFTNTPSGCGFSSFAQLDVWYSFEANGTDDYTVTVDAGATSTSWDGVLYVYSGTCDSLTEVGCSDATFGGGSESVTLEAPAAGTYLVQFYDFSGSDTYAVSLTCETGCADPFPAVDPASISTTIQVEETQVLAEWDAVEGQIGCQVQLRFANGSVIKTQLIEGEDVNSAIFPGFLLDYNTSYEWRVRCGCSVDPLIAGPVSAWQLFTTPGAPSLISSPNPTAGPSNVTFSVVEDGYTTLEVYDMSGRLIDAIFNGVAQPNNEYRFEFDGSALPNGVYIYRLTTESDVVNEKFMIAK